MNKEEFIDDIITPLRCLNYWIGKLEWYPESPLEIIKTINTSPKEYKWCAVNKEILDKEIDISMPIGKCDDGKNDVFLDITISENNSLMVHFKEGIRYVGILFCEIHQKGYNKLVLKSGITGTMLEVDIDEDLINRANMYIEGLVSIYLEKFNLLNKNGMSKFNDSINKFISLKDVINKNPKEFFSTDNMDKIVCKVNTDNIIRTVLSVDDSSIKIIVRPENSTTLNKMDSVISLEYNSENNECQAYLYPGTGDPEAKIEIDHAQNDIYTGNAINFSISGTHVYRMYVNATKYQEFKMSGEVNEFADYINKLELKEPMTPKEYTAKELNSVEKNGKPKAIEEIFRRVSIIAEYLNKKKDSGDSKKAEDEIRDIIESSDEMSGMVSSQYLFPLNIMIYYDYRNKSKIAITIERDECSPYDVYVHQIMDKPIRPKYPIKVADFGSDSQLIEIDKYNMFSVSMSSKQIKLILEDLEYIIDKLGIEYDKAGSNRETTSDTENV